MTTVFKQPPLVEIVAEVRWGIPGLPKVPAQFARSPLPVPDTSIHEIHFMNFASRAGAKGFGLVERVVPAGFPLFAHQVAFRYRNTTGIEGAPIFQVGPGIFTANISPPYKSWEGFVPFIELGLDLLLESRSDQDKNREFSDVRLRYLDAFGENLRQEKPIARFLLEDLGVHVRLPEAIMNFCSDQEAIKPNISVKIPIAIGSMELKISEGWVRNASSLVMDTTIVCSGPFAPEKGKILAALNSAHHVIHDSFVGMTHSLHPLMQPAE